MNLFRQKEFFIESRAFIKQINRNEIRISFTEPEIQIAL